MHTAGALFALLGATSLALAWLMQRERLPRNGLVGMRTTATLSSDQAWMAAHRASAWSLALAGMILLAAGTWQLLTSPSADTAGNVRISTGIAVLAVVLVGGIQAQRVAKRNASAAAIPDGPASPAGHSPRVLPELVAVVVLALIGLAAWPFAPDTLPLHWGVGGFGTFASSWVALVAVPSSCAAVAACLVLSRYRERPDARQWVRLLLLIPAAALLLALAFVTL